MNQRGEREKHVRRELQNWRIATGIQLNNLLVLSSNDMQIAIQIHEMPDGSQI